MWRKRQGQKDELYQKLAEHYRLAQNEAQTAVWGLGMSSLLLILCISFVFELRAWIKNKALFCVVAKRSERHARNSRDI